MRSLSILLAVLLVPAAQAQWTQLGADIPGEAPDDHAGSAVSLDGDRLAIGALWNDGANGVNSGHVRVYQWDLSGWVQLGADLDGEASGDFFGVPVSLDGDRVAVGARRHEVDGVRAGHVQVYEWDGTAWAQLGADLEGRDSGEGYGLAVSLDGDRLAIGAPGADVNGRRSGRVQVFEWDGEAWVQLGADLAGEAESYSHGEAVSLSGDRLAVGAPTVGLEGLVPGAGRTRIYEWDGEAWGVLGEDIMGKTAEDSSGRALSLDGDRLAIGAPLADRDTVNVGATWVYEWDGTAWVQLGADLDGDTAQDFSGMSVSLSGDRLAIGSRPRPGGSFGAGFAWVCEWDGSAWTRVATIEGGAPDELLGLSVSLSGDRLAVGVPLRDDVGVGVDGADRGAAAVYVLDRPSAVSGTTALGPMLRAVVPNPSAGAATVTWALARAGEARLSVVDLLGREVALLAEGAHPVGRHRAVVPTGRLAPGVYVVRLAAGATVEAVRFTVVR